jgi:hypothetical protein
MTSSDQGSGLVGVVFWSIAGFGFSGLFGVLVAFLLGLLEGSL